MDEERESWEGKDAWLGLLFFLTGVPALTATILIQRNGYSISFWLIGYVVGPLLILLGGNAVFRGSHEG